MVKDTVSIDTKSYQGPTLMASTLSEELIVSYQYDVTPNPKFASKYALMGEGKDSDIKIRVETAMEKIIETIFIRHDATHIISNRDAIRNEIERELRRSVYQDEFDSIGVIVNMTTGKIDFTADVSKARQQKRLMELDKAAADLLTKNGTDPSVKTKDALAHIRARAGVTTSQDHHFHVPPGVKFIPAIVSGGGGKP
jgi:hypothetical protein